MADYAKLIQAKKWKKLAKVGQGKKMEEVIAVAAACGKERCEEAYNILVDIMARPETEAKIAGIKGLSTLRYDISSQITRILWLKDHGGADVPAIADAIQTAVADLREAQRAAH